jgi:predicted phosphoadenosine phosphosulfate sulfurtransferase
MSVNQLCNAMISMPKSTDQLYQSEFPCACKYYKKKDAEHVSVPVTKKRSTGPVDNTCELQRCGELPLSNGCGVYLCQESHGNMVRNIVRSGYTMSQTHAELTAK